MAGLRVLVVDDEPLINNLLIKGLGHYHKDWVITAEREVQSARVRLLSEEAFGVILLDVLLPDVNGMILFRELEAKAPHRCSKVIFITGGTLIPAIISFLKTVPNSVVEKPFTFTEIEDAIGDLLGNGAP